MFCCNLYQTRDVTLSYGKTWQKEVVLHLDTDESRLQLIRQLESVRVRLPDHFLLSSSVMTAQQSNYMYCHMQFHLVGEMVIRCHGFI